MFATLDICKTYDLEIEKGIYIPLKIHIKDIKEPKGIAEYEKEEPYILKSEDKETRLYKSHSENNFSYVRELIRQKEEVKKYFKYIDVDIKIFDNGKKNMMEFYELESLDELLYNLDSNSFSLLIETCDKIVSKVLEEYFIALDKFLNNGSKEPNIPKENKGKDVYLAAIEKFMAKPKGYLVAQLGVEYESNIFFEENIGKAIRDWSFREIEFQIRYIQEKNKVDGLLEQWKAFTARQQENKQKSR